jgi:hypothetical protein
MAATISTRINAGALKILIHEEFYHEPARAKHRESGVDRVAATSSTPKGAAITEKY